MDEQSQATLDVGASADPNMVPEAPPSARLVADEQRLERLLRHLLKGLVAAVAIFAIVYFFGQRQSHVEQAAPIPDQAVVSAEAAVRERPNDLAARLTLASNYAQANRIDDALEQLREILRVAPDYQPALLGVGEMLYSKGELEEARSALLKYVGIGKQGEFASADPQLERANYKLGSIELKLDMVEDAVKHLETAVRIDDSDADAWYTLGLALNRVERFSEAVLAFKRAVAFVPTGWCEPYAGLEDAFAGLSTEDGETFAGSMLRVCRGGGLQAAAPLRDLTSTEYAASALYGLGQAAENDKDEVEALRFYQQVLSLERTNVAALAAIARLGATPAPLPVKEN